MSLKRKGGNRKWSATGAVMLGLGVGFALLLFGSALLAWLIIRDKLQLQSIGVGSGIIMVIASGLGAWVTAAAARSKRLQMIGIFAGVFFGLLLSVTALVFGGQYSGVLVYGICILVGAGGCALLGFLPKKAGAKGRKIRSYR